jgi:energy-coupling factor transporter transmembrane protein EcfT
MKLYIRLVLTFPLLFITLIYLRYRDPDDACSGMMDLFFDLVIIICSLFALLAIFLKRKAKKFIAEPISLIIYTFAALIVLFVSIYPGHTTGKIWFTAKSADNQNLVESKTLTIRQNGNFTFEFVDADFGCTISGSYKKSGDTIFIDDKGMEKIGREADAAYIITKNKLIPVKGTDSSREYFITNVK